MILFAFYMVSFVLLVLGFFTHNRQYHEAIDPVDNCYMPFAINHITTLILYFITYNISALLIWVKGQKLPPLALVLALVFLCIGIIINVAILIQVISHNTATLDNYKGYDGTFLFIFTPLLSIIIGFILLLKTINEEKDVSKTKSYNNKFLNYCNSILANRFDASVWTLLLLIPVFLVITIILVLFGQDVNSITRVFTDTTTWTFSQKAHPPILDHRGHYLCTVAAKGSPKIVKPIFLGKRNNSTIIVNRQLQIANAFEEMVKDISPKAHRFIRKNYDNYGYNLSVTINSKIGSNITYLLMKPLEWIFLISLYLICEKPEIKITKQYEN